MRLGDVRPVHVADVVVDGEPWPGHLHVIEHPDGRILVDTGMIDSTPELDEEWRPTIYPERIPRDVSLVVNTHLHFDHCGGEPPLARPPQNGRAAGRGRGEISGGARLFKKKKKKSISNTVRK